MSFDVCGSKVFEQENKTETSHACICCDTGNSMHHKMKFEKFRLESFKNWPVPYIDVYELAKDGFYFLGLEDRVECTFCLIKIKNWEAENTARDEHLKWSPQCPIVKGNQTDNVPLIKKARKFIIIKNVTTFNI
jgi:ssDNA-binding Zn-finger/Zn-ribbon topoisomerase 1